MLQRNSFKIIVVFFLLVLLYAVYRDIPFCKQNQSDFRNRMVGARLIKDGRSPYFYKWKKGDGTRYYDPKSFDSFKVSNITASPFFHHLMYPLAELPQAQASKWWMAFQYSMFIAMVFMAILFAATTRQKILVLIAATLFLFTAAWKGMMLVGQNYLCIPFLSMAFFYFIKKKESWLTAATAGLCAAMLVLIRPNAFIFFIPFLWLYKNYSRKYILVFMAPFVLICTWILFDKQESFLWLQYKENISAQISKHQNSGAALQVNEPDPGFIQWEGIDKNETQRLRATYHLTVPSENGNVYMMVWNLFHKRMPLWLMNVLCVCTLLLIAGLFSWTHKKNNPPALPDIALLGFCLYMITDLFSPIIRYQYYTVQWMFPLLVSPAYFRQSVQWIFFLLGAAIMLLILPPVFVSYQFTVSEYLMLLSFTLLALGGPFKTAGTGNDNLRRA